MTSLRGWTSPPTAQLSRTVSESCCFDRPASDDELDPDDSEVKVAWLAQAAAGKVSRLSKHASVGNLLMTKQ